MQIELQQKLIETVIICCILFNFTRTREPVIIGFFMISLYRHLDKLFKLLTNTYIKQSKSILQKLFYAFISVILLVYCIRQNDKIILMSGLFVFFSKIIDFFSEDDTIIEEIFTLILSIISVNLI
jgi:hypothetical protein